MRVLAINVGSSSLKLTLLDEREQILASAHIQEPSGRLDERALQATLRRDFAGCEAVGHRFVHGGPSGNGPRVIDAGVIEELLRWAQLAPLHQAKCLRALHIAREAFPDLDHVACFDTAFHADLPEAARTYALPADWRQRFGLRRFGFHGLSHEWVAKRTCELLGAGRPSTRIVSAHLGAGASLCAIKDGRSVDTTMGFTPAEGLVMATRSGSIDPGMLTWLAAPQRLGLAALADGIEHQSGLVGLAGTADMRLVLEQAQAGRRRATAAIDIYIHRLRAQIAAMAAALGGIDVLSFTGGIGEASAQVRQLSVEGLGFLGLKLNHAANSSVRADADLSSADAQCSTLVIFAREDLMIARQSRAVLASG